jgi:hypothetical protein
MEQAQSLKYSDCVSNRLTSILATYSLLNEQSRDSLDRATSHAEVIQVLSEYKTLLNDYQKIYFETSNI